VRHFFFSALKNYCTWRDLICWLLRVKGITEVMVGKLYLQFVAEGASRQVAEAIAGECSILKVNVLALRFLW
jgi:hypothetical protein